MTDIFSLDVRRARKGDCMLLHFGTPQAPRVMLIDGGPTQVYAPFLRPRLMEMRVKRQLQDAVPLPIDVVMVSHIDDDHIQGILDLTREAITRDNEHKPPLFQLRALWHNSFDDLVGKVPAELASTAASVCASLSGDGGTAGTILDERGYSAAMVLASVPQGRQLRSDAERLHVPVNGAFDGELIRAGAHPGLLADQVDPKVVGPTRDELVALKKQHDDWLKAHPPSTRTEQSLAAYVDESVTNLSSIVALVEAGGKRMLLTGDARGDSILAGLESAGLLAANGTLHVDILKVPHHGSSNNVEKGFFERIVADHYVFSGNGENGNPERETMEMLLSARGDAPFTIHLTYPLDEIDAARKADWLKQRGREVKLAAKSSKAKKPRPDWSAETQSLTAFFSEGRLRQGQVLSVVDKQRAHVIDLLDPLGF
jgi:hypothetical protein